VRVELTEVSVDGREHWPRMSLEVAGLIFAMAVVGYVECAISHGLSCCNTFVDNTFYVCGFRSMISSLALILFRESCHRLISVCGFLRRLSSNPKSECIIFFLSA
jgi:hypothetical protein